MIRTTHQSIRWKANTTNIRAAIALTAAVNTFLVPLRRCSSALSTSGSRPISNTPCAAPK